MIAETGLFALVLALFVAGVQATLPLIGASRADPTWMAVARPAAFVQFTLVTLAFGALMWLHVTSDFSVLNVVENSHTDKPLLYKITGVWGNHEGSMLLWTFILALYGMAVTIFGGNLPPALRARVLAVQGMIAFGFLLFIILTSNPFQRINPPPLNGEGLNPLLQDPGLAFHPPFLYLGYVGFSMAFSFAIAALIEGRVDAAWARWVRPWTLVAWCALTLGVAMGAWWSYYTLGWGGWWAWDPVENASFMPWLAGTALLHSAIVVEKRNALRAWTIFLAIVTFSFSLLGTFLVRSGVLTSVHSFATDPRRGVFVLLLLTGVTGASLVLFLIRAPVLKSGGLFAPISREGGLLFNNLVLSTAAGTVLLGTLYPLFADALGLGKVSVGPPYFNIVLVPLMLPMLLVMAVGPLLAWKRGDLGRAFAKLKFAALALVVTLVATWIAAGVSAHSLLASAGLGVAAWLLVGSVTGFAHSIGLFHRALPDALRRARHLPRATYGMTIAHIGVAIVLVGISGSLAWKTEKLLVMHPGDSMNVAGYDVRLAGVEPGVRGPNYTASRATFIATRHGRFVALLQPERRMYDNPQQAKSTVAIHTNFVSDLYAVLGDPDGKGGFVVHAYHNPLVPWLFFGAVVMVFGGLVSLSDRRHRIGAPRRGRFPSAAQFIPAAVRTSPVPAAPGWAVIQRWQFALPLAAFTVLVGFFVYRLYLAGAGDTPNFVPSVMIGAQAPEFDLPTLTAGRTNLKTSDFAGKVTLINFFASWCAPCRVEHPVLPLARRAGINLVGIDYEDTPSAARIFLAAFGDPYQTVAVDLEGRAGIDFGVYGVPESYLIDRKGVIRFKYTGPLTPTIVRDKLIPLAEKLAR